MKTDRELLDLAAKAAGIELEWLQDYGGADFLDPKNKNGWQIWNPLTDDGDALRLAVKLGLGIVIPPDFASDADVDIYKNQQIVGFSVKRDGEMDYVPTTRRAIVCAAAAIGESMP